MKKTLYLLLFFFSLFFLSSCGNNNTPPVDNTDKVKPNVIIYNPTTADAGIIKLEYEVSDNVTSADKLVVNIICVKDGMMVEVENNEFMASEAGIYSIQVSAVDEAGNKGSASLDITVSGSINTGSDTVKPTVFVNAPDSAYIGQEVSISYDVSDNASFSSEILVDVKVSKNNEDVNLTDNKFIIGEGIYNVVVTATDKAGNVTIMTKQIIGKVDDVLPVIEVGDLSGIAVGDEVALSYIITDNVTNSEKLIPEVTLERNEKIRYISGNTFDVIDDGEYTLTLTVTDEAGNTATKVVRFNVDYKREDRNMDKTLIGPENTVNEDNFILADATNLVMSGKNYVMKSQKYNIVFVHSEAGYYVNFVNGSNNDVMFTMPNPIILYLKSVKNATSLYQSVEFTRYGVLASGTITTSNGSVLTVNDRYYYPDNDSVTEAINVQREIEVIEYSTADYGYQSVFAILTVDNKPQNLDWFIPNNAFGKIDTGTQTYKIYRETLCGLPMVMFRDSTTGYSISLARYKPVIDSATNSYACVGAFYGENSVDSNASSIEINYPTRDTARKYFDIEDCHRVVYDMTIMADITESFDEAYINCYNNQYLLEDVRIVNTDIEECYKVVNQDFKKVLLSRTRNGITSYGLPWRITIENGLIGPMSYQAGFVGQQIPCAYNMMLYGVKYNDKQSLENGIKVINFWIHDAKMMTSAGVPMIWYDGASNRWLGYPTFTRMAVDAMEGLFDAYRLAVANGIEVDGWIEAITACAEWLVKAQNSDGSWYRCYNYQGTYYKGTESDITWNPGNIAKSTSKNNSTMPVRFLGKMYEFTGEAKYLNAVKKAGNFIYNNLYTQHAYFGGTCDNPDCMDKEAGVYAMYAYDTLYTLTGDEKWIECLEQATVFTMSSVITFSFKIPDKASDLKAAYSLECGYTDGLSYITCMGTSIDNYAAYIYYQLFRLYVHTGKEVYYKMAEFIQQNTKSTMDWDGVLGYTYKSLTPEASTIYAFGYASAKDDDGVMGVWLPWQSAANAEPIAKMMDTFGVADVRDLKNTSIEELRRILKAFGVGGNVHRKF